MFVQTILDLEQIDSRGGSRVYDEVGLGVGTMGVAAVLHFAPITASSKAPL